MRKSTGPRTPRGKARSSQNAAKHWIESGRILPEEEKDAAILRSGFMKDFDPQSSIEIELIDDLTLNRLVKRRIDRAFSRESIKAGIQDDIDLLDHREHSAKQFWLRISSRWRAYRIEGEVEERLRPEVCIVALEWLKQRISEHGLQPEEDEAMLRVIYGDQPTEYAALAMHRLARAAEEQKAQDQKTSGTSDEGLKQEILSLLEMEIRMQRVRRGLTMKGYEADCKLPRQEPAPPTAEMLQRYRAANASEFKHLLDSLERIRRLRQGAAANTTCVA